MSISLTIADDVAEIVMNAPERLNALNPQDIEDLSQAHVAPRPAPEGGDL